VWQGGCQREPALLQSCYRQCFALAHEHGLHRLAFPAISCGVYGYPHAEAAEIAVTETLHALQHYPNIEQVIFACYSAEMAAIYTATLARLQHALDSKRTG
jgi:O-acetyl-ADP-ribose deacetylase (regulator of RNase III)